MVIGIDGRALQQKPWSGVGQYTYHLLHALFALDRENEYVVWYNAAGALEVPQFSEYQNVRVHKTRWPNQVLNSLYKAKLCTTAQSLALNSLDLFFMPNLNFIALPSATKLILTIHDLSFVHFPEHFSWKSRLWHRAVNPRQLLARADHIIAVSEHTKGDLVETYGIAQEKVTVVYSGINPMSELKPQTYNLKPQSYILYFGALEPRKNIEGLIATFETLQTKSVDPHAIRRSVLHLIIAGLSTPYVQHLRQRIARSLLHDKITVLENPTEAEKQVLYARAAIFVYPSFYEGFGFPPLEAMAQGVPVVASSVSSIPEICGEAAVLVNPWKTEEIAEGMRVLLENERLRQKYRERGKTRTEQFSWTQCAQQVQKIFS